MKQYYKSFLIKYAEIGVKGKNRHLFEAALIRQIKQALRKVEGTFSLHKTSGRIYVETDGDYDYAVTVDVLQKIFGIAGICPMLQLADNGFDTLCGSVITYIGDVYAAHTNAKSFKVMARRSNKYYPLDSMEINARLGEALLTAYPNWTVDVHAPAVTVHVEIREHINLYSEIIPGPGGLPVGIGGKAALLLSGGIDSPVAGYMIAKRGIKIDAVYFHAPPYTSERAKQKVMDLARIVSSYAGPIYLYVINFTDIQRHIYDRCPHEELTIIMRRYMMRIAERIARDTGCLGLITGESIGQVASQTLQSLAATDAVCQLPVYRPLIGMDKLEIIRAAEKIGTYETSILPYEDCCTIFVAKHPVTKPNIKRINFHEQALSEKMDELVEAALETKELVVLS